MRATILFSRFHSGKTLYLGCLHCKRNEHPDRKIDYQQLHQSSRNENEHLSNKLTQLQHELNMLKKMIFGSRQERFVSAENTNQLSLDITAEAMTTCEIGKATKVEYTRNKITSNPLPHPGRTKLPAHLRREEIILEPAFIPAGSKWIAQEETEQLECIPAELYVKNIYAQNICYRMAIMESRLKLL